MTLLIVLVSLLVGVGSYQLHFILTRRKLASLTWEDMLAKIEPIELESLQIVAECYLQPGKDQLRLEPNQMWDMVGGIEGIRRLKANAQVMLELAIFAESWNEEQGPIISEMIRRDAIRINKAVVRIQLSLLFRVPFIRAPFHLQEAASSYYLIRRRLLGLYHNSHIALVPRLEAAL
jgi:hypothetical protein